jgi:hypothetical protein
MSPMKQGQVSVPLPLELKAFVEREAAREDRTLAHGRGCGPALRLEVVLPRQERSFLAKGPLRVVFGRG